MQIAAGQFKTLTGLLNGILTAVKANRPADAVDAYSIKTFCERHEISVQLFYKLRKQMPETFTIGDRVLISREAAAKWRASRK
ncbi:hypothetical protein [Bradyrhizobium sp. S3.7.6]